MKTGFKNLLLIVFLTVVAIEQALVLPSCANMMPPEGGFRDSLPPNLLKATPADSSKNFHSNEVTLVFDEFVQLDNPTQNLIISPIPSRAPQVDSRLRTVTIKFKDSLEPNTTYTLNFGNTIRDYNEGNILRNFTYIFSTGNSFDSMTLNGNVILAENGKVDTTLIVMLHKDPSDSAVVNVKPRYVTRLDQSGHFEFRNLPAGIFHIYALKTQGGYSYNAGKDLFAFADKPVNTADSNAAITLYAYGSPTVSPFSQLNLPQRGARTTSDKRLKFQTNTPTGTLDLQSDFIITFDQPVKILDSNKISIRTDSSFTPVSSHQYSLDTSQKKLSIHTSWKENTPYHVILDKDFAEDSSGRRLLKTDTLNFKTKKQTDYGSLRIRLRNLDLSKHPVLLFVQNDNIIRSEPLKAADVSFPLFTPGDYELRILSDRNQNGKWDPGEFFGKHIQPEIVTPITSRPRITIKSNWQNEFDIAL